MKALEFIRLEDGAEPWYLLHCHPDTPSRGGIRIRVLIKREKRYLYLIYVIECDTTTIRLAPPAKPCRADGLWNSTCCELFARCDGLAYEEFNFAPSGQWAAYSFAGYRLGMEALGVDGPPCVTFVDEELDRYLYLSVMIPQSPHQSTMSIGLSAVIEETDGTKSYWALAHPPGKPDFHHPDCFALTLPAVG